MQAFAHPKSFVRKRAIRASYTFLCVFCGTLCLNGSFTFLRKVEERRLGASTPTIPKLGKFTSNSSYARALEPAPEPLEYTSERWAFNLELAGSKFRSILNESRLDLESIVSCDNSASDSIRALEYDFDEILKWSFLVRANSKLLRLVKSETPRVFVAGLLRNNCELIGHYVVEVLKFVLLYGSDDGFENILLSLFAGGERDCSAPTLDLFGELLDIMRVPHVIKTRQCERKPTMARIDFLQRIRNAVMEPLYTSKKSFDEVVFLSDAFFCAGDVVRLLRHSEASIKCGLDFDGVLNAMKFRDTWVAHDISGYMFTKEFPFVRDDASSHAMRSGRPFQVLCCWNGLLTLNAKLFTEHGLRFRRSIDETECHGAETELICHDSAALGFSKILVDPEVTVAYTKAEYIALRDSQPSVRSYSLRRTDLLANRTIHSVEKWSVLPSSTECAPLDGHTGDHPDRGRTHLVDWKVHYVKMGVPVASNKTVTSLLSCSGPSAHECTLRDGNRTRASRSVLDWQ